MFQMKFATTFAIVYTMLLCPYGSTARRITRGAELNFTQNANLDKNTGKNKNFTVVKLKSNFGDGHIVFGDIKALGDNATKIANAHGAKGNFSTFRMLEELPLERDAANKNKSSALVGTLGAAADIIVTNKDGTVNQTIKVSTIKSGIKHSNAQHKHLNGQHSKIHRNVPFKRRHGHRPRRLKNAKQHQDKTVSGQLPERHFGMEVETVGSHGKSLRPLTVSKMFNLANFFLGDVDPFDNSAPFTCGSEKITFIDGKPSQAKYEFSRSIRDQSKKSKRFISSSLGSQKVQAPCPVHDSFGAIAKNIFGICTCGSGIFNI